MEDSEADAAAAARAAQIVAGMIGDKHGAPQPQQKRPGFQQRHPSQGQGQGQGQGQNQGEGGRRRRHRRRGRGGDRDRFQQGGPGQPGFRPPQGQQPQRGPQTSVAPGQTAPAAPITPVARIEAGVTPAAEAASPADAALVGAGTVPFTPAPVSPVSPVAEAATMGEAAVQEHAVEVPGQAQVVAPAPQIQGTQGVPQQQRPDRQQHRRDRERDREPGQVPAPAVRKVVLMNASDPGEIRVAILENGELAEIFMERKSRGQQAGNIYKGRVVNVEPSLQAAFVDLGTERNGFLHASDCIPPDGGYGDILTKFKPAGRPDQQQQQPQQRGRDRGDRGNRGDRGPRGDRHDSRGGQSHQQHQQQRHGAQQPTAPASTDIPAASEGAQPAAAANLEISTAATEEVNVTPVLEPAVNSAPNSSPIPAETQSGDMAPAAPAPSAPAINGDDTDTDADFETGDDGDDDAPDNELEGPVNAGEAASADAQPQQSGQPGKPGQRPPHAENSQNGARRRRRRRGGRGRSGRGRPPGAAPMMAPNHSNPESSEHTDRPREGQGSENAPAHPVAAPNASDAPSAPENSHESHESHTAPAAEAPRVDSAPEVSTERESAPVQNQEESTALNDAPQSDPAAQAAEAPAASADSESSDANGNDAPAEGAKSGAGEPVEDDPETEIDTDNIPAAPVETEQANGSDWLEHPVSEELQSTEIVIPEQKAQTPSVREAAPIPAPGQPAPALTQPRQGGGRSGRGTHDRRYTIQEMLREGQEVLIQVAKEGIGQKGPALTTYLSMPGRYLVLMPAVQRLGVSKRIENEEQRRALKDALNQLNPPDDMGVIVRTAGTGRGKEELQRDMDYLVRVWETLKKKAKVAKAPALVYQEGDVVTRVFRDVITDDVAEIVIDDPVVAERAREFLRETAPGNEHKVRLYSEPEPLFHKQGVEQQLQRLFNRKVNLRSGGSIVIEQTEALVAIDVNTGRFREKRSQDDTILATNLEAAREVARQLRLRDIGGLVMIDFIDMEIHEHRRRVERELKAHLARDKARINVLPISSLGIVEMTRQRIRHSLRKTLFDRCPHCSGSGHVKSAESLGLDMLREIKGQLRDNSTKRVLVRVNSVVAFDILNQFRKDLARLEETRGITIEVRGDGAVPLSQIQVSTAKEGGEWVLKKISEVDDYVRNS